MDEDYRIVNGLSHFTCLVLFACIAALAKLDLVNAIGIYVVLAVAFQANESEERHLREVGMDAFDREKTDAGFWYTVTILLIGGIYYLPWRVVRSVFIVLEDGIWWTIDRFLKKGV